MKPRYSQFFARNADEVKFLGLKEKKRMGRSRNKSQSRPRKKTLQVNQQKTHEQLDKKTEEKESMFLIPHKQQSVHYSDFFNRILISPASTAIVRSSLLGGNKDVLQQQQPRDNHLKSLQEVLDKRQSEVVKYRSSDKQKSSQKIPKLKKNSPVNSQKYKKSRKKQVKSKKKRPYTSSYLLKKKSLKKSKSIIAHQNKTLPTEQISHKPQQIEQYPIVSNPKEESMATMIMKRQQDICENLNCKQLLSVIMNKQTEQIFNISAELEMTKSLQIQPSQQRQIQSIVMKDESLQKQPEGKIQIQKLLSPPINPQVQQQITQVRYSNTSKELHYAYPEQKYDLFSYEQMRQSYKTYKPSQFSQQQLLLLVNSLDSVQEEEICARPYLDLVYQNYIQCGGKMLKEAVQQKLVQDLLFLIKKENMKIWHDEALPKYENLDLN